MPYSISFLRENHAGRTSGMNRVPALMCDFSMIGISNNRSAGLLAGLKVVQLTENVVHIRS
jgi:hypothetical protein